MSREIKFRCWDNKENRYVRIQNLNFVDNQPSSVSYHKKGHKGFTNTRYPNFILEQYTGLKDRNGKEIYEGDIVTMEYDLDDLESDDYYLITFSNGCFRVGNGYVNEAGPYLSDWQVIGNIHENLELIGGKDE